MSVIIDRSGWRRGLALVAVYAPLSDRQHAAERTTFYDELRLVEHMSRGPDHVLVVGGDFNAEVGRPLADVERECIGHFGNPRRTESGGNLSIFAAPWSGR